MLQFSNRGAARHGRESLQARIHEHYEPESSPAGVDVGMGFMQLGNSENGLSVFRSWLSFRNERGEEACDQQVR